MRRLSHAADYSKLSIASSVDPRRHGGDTGRRAAASGLACVATTSAAVNLVVKPFARRRRPNRAENHVPAARRVAMPTSASFPSGHTAAAVAFASGAGRVAPLASVPLHGLAAIVGYSRVHTGVHYPGDVVAGALIGAVVADLAAAILTRRSGSWPVPTAGPRRWVLDRYVDAARPFGRELRVSRAARYAGAEEAGRGVPADQRKGASRRGCGVGLRLVECASGRRIGLAFESAGRFRRPA